MQFGILTESIRVVRGSIGGLLSVIEGQGCRSEGLALGRGVVWVQKRCRLEEACFFSRMCSRRRVSLCVQKDSGYGRAGCTTVGRSETEGVASQCHELSCFVVV